MELLVRVAQGRPPTDTNKRGYYPFGSKAAQSTREFKKVPFTNFAHTLTVIYPFIRFDKNEWKDKALHTAAHPMNAGGLWHISLMKRYEKFFKLCHKKLPKLFESYEEQDGEYHGAEHVQQTSGLCGTPRRKLTMVDVQNMTDDDDENSMDTEFM